MNDSDSLKKILIFDDDADLRKLLVTYLGKLFPDVELEQYDPVASGVPAKDFDWARYDILILDYYLCIHGVTGLDILQQNRKNLGFPATIMLTGAGNEEVAMRALKAGVYDYLRKQNLDKQELKNSILLAFEKHKQARKRQTELTQQGAAFNKSLFYQQLEFHKDSPEFRRRVLLLIELDDHVALEESAGMILRDNMIRHIARQSYEVFRLGDCNPIVTRLGDYSIALLIDAPDSRKTLEFNLNGLITHLDKRPYKFGDKLYHFTVSIGALALPGQGQSAEVIIKYARAACKSATQAGKSSFYIFTGDKPATATAPAVAPNPVVAPVKETAPVKGDHKQVETPVIEKPPVVAPTGTDPKPKPVPAAPVAKPPVEHAPAAPQRPLKSLEELKAEALRPKPPVEAEKAAPVAVNSAATPAPKVSESADQLLDISKLDEAGLHLKQAFDEKRVVQVFQPVISLMNEDMETDDEIHKVSLELIDHDGSVRNAAEIMDGIKLPEFRKFVDRWLLREIFGRLINSKNNRYTFVVDISDASLADAGFFNWLRKLLTGMDAANPGKYLVLEINAKHLANVEKQASALITYLRKTHDIKFVLGNVDNMAEIAGFTSRIKFDLVRCNFQLINELGSQVAQASAPGESAKYAGNSQLDLIKSAGSRFIADNIEDATTLTEVISLGTEYAMGHFIGEATTQLDDITNIETFEII